MKIFKMAIHTPIRIVALSLLLLGSIQAKSANEDIEILVAAENIAILSQSIVKNYFYIGNNINSSSSKKKMAEEIKKIDTSLAMLASYSQFRNIQADLEFVSMIWSDFKISLAEPYTRDNGLLLVDMGEVMLEGSENLTRILVPGNSSATDKVSDLEFQRYLIERMAKLYVISIAGLKDFNIEKQMKLAVDDFNAGMSKISDQSYPQDITVQVNRLSQRWDSSRDYYLNVKEGDLPKTVFFNTSIIERYLLSILDYYKDS